MTKPFYTPAATQDLTEILALAWVEKFEEKCLLIAFAPESGELKPQLGDGVRASVLGRYVIFHRRANKRVEILRVIPGDRDVRNL